MKKLTSGLIAISAINALMPQQPKIKFKRTKPRIWLGDGMGYDPAEYGVCCGGAIVGHISYSGGYWRIAIDDFRMGFRALGVAKAYARDRIGKNYVAQMMSTELDELLRSGNPR